MTYVWIEETSGRKRFVDDQWLNPCRNCGKRISVCRENNCLTGNEVEPAGFNDEYITSAEMVGLDGCSSCGSATNQACHCDNDYESAVGK